MIENEDDARRYCRDVAGAEACLRLEWFVDALLVENTRQNLVSRPSLNHVWQRHIADSVQLLPIVPRGTLPWLDLGTGAGFPGLIIALCALERSVILVESRRRRAQWLRSVVDHLQLDSCRVLHQRLEQVRTFAAGVISARAFAPLPVLLDLSTRFSTTKTVTLLPKGRSARMELDALPNDLRRMFHVEQSLTDPGAGIIVGRGRLGS